MQHFRATFTYRKRRWYRPSTTVTSHVIINANDITEALRIARCDSRMQQPRAQLTVDPLPSLDALTHSKG